MVKTSNKVAQKIRFLPDTAGIYIWKDLEGSIIYVGKAKNLNNRIKSYLTVTIKDPKTEQLVNNIADLEYIITDSETDAFILEANLIKEHRPKYNILLKDDKRYPFIKITYNEAFPRLIITRDLKHDGGKYYGPYTDSFTLRKTLRMLEWIFPIRSCKRDIPSDRIVFNKACINFQLKKCFAPCIGNIDVNTYMSIIKNVELFFNGKYHKIVEILKLSMQLASDKDDFELAAKLRDQISEIDKIQKRQNVFLTTDLNLDILGIYIDSDISYVVVLRMFSGKLLNQESYPMSNVKNRTHGEILSAFLKLYYTDRMELPSEIWLPLEPEDIADLNIWLRNKVRVPQKGEKTKLLLIAQKNAYHLVEEQKLSHLKKANRTIKPIQELKDKLNLRTLPRKIVCMDISTIQGTDTVSSAVFFQNGKPLKKNYRHFIIKTIDQQNDFAAMAETIDRYMVEIEKYPELTPDLLIIDGGKGQLSSVMNILKTNNTQFTVISIAKRVEEIFLPDKSDSIILSRSSPSLRLVTNIRDEAHRFAINFHRHRRSKRTLISELEDIPGVGEKTKFLLLKEFGSVLAVKSASVEEMQKIKGIGHNTSVKLFNYFHNN